MDEQTLNLLSVSTLFKYTDNFGKTTLVRRIIFNGQPADIIFDNFGARSSFYDIQSPNNSLVIYLDHLELA